MTLRVFQVPSPKHYTGRSGMHVIALVHHRMVGTLRSTDVTFTTDTRPASTNFGVGYDCGRAGHPTGLAGTHVHQYVMVDDAAWGNGNLDLTGGWDNVYGATLNPNFRTISIEHHDNGGATLGSGRKGVVPEEVIRASIELDALLLSGDWLAWKAAGIRANTDAKGAAIAAQVKAIAPSSKTLIDHNYIAGKLKPFCWKPWADDRLGFPQARYIAALTAPAGGSDVAAKPVTDVTPKLIDWLASTPYYALDGTTKLGTAGATTGRFSPFACGAQRAFYAGTAPDAFLALVT
ncbi:MAG: hypothetical protein L0221_10030, partial [Chloroflexi bacterium]|nr:hypothetical protein [Chloroflexota bacterium]